MHKHWFQTLGVLLFVALILTGCASWIVADSMPLSPGQLNPPGRESISSGGMRLSALSTAGRSPDLLVIVAISGGGKRSAAYSYGVLDGMRDVPVQTQSGPQSLLQLVDAISGVSGGSVTAAYYGLYRDAAFGRYRQDFLYRDTNSNIFGIYLLPWNWLWLVDPSIGTNDFMERVYDRTMFHGARFDELAARGRPLIAIGATEISDGSPFLFTQETFDLICSDLGQFPVARAVAASNGFPGLFSPITLTNHAAKCGHRQPGWLRGISEAERRNPLSRRGVQANLAQRYLDPERVRYLHLSDGGIADNLALRSAGSMMQNLAESPADLIAHGFDRLRRILVISVDGQSAQDPSVSQRWSVGGLFAILGLVKGNTIDRFNFETVITVHQQLNQITQAIRTARCREGPMIDGAPCDDVKSALIPISLSALPATPENERLLAIPTGLTLRRPDVDALIAAGQTAITTSPQLRSFLNNYPPRSLALTAR